MAVRIGFIGAGGIAASHLQNLLKVPEAEVVALCDLSQAQIDATREKVNQRLEQQDRRLEAASYDDYQRMLRDERLDAVYLCLPPFAHGEPEEAVMAAGLPMLVEKPVARELPVAARLLDSIRRREIVAATGYQMRYAPVVQHARRLLEGRTVGMAVVMRFGATPRTSWYHLQRLSGGQMIEMATHQVDMLRYLVGEVKTVYAAGATRINNRSRPDYDIFDVNCMTLSFENGALANFAANFVAPNGPPPGAQGLHIFCDGLTLSLGRSLRAVFDDRVEELPLEGDAMAFEDQAFVRAVSEGRPELILSDYESAVRTLAVTVANDRSARTGQPIEVPALLAAEVPGL